MANSSAIILGAGMTGLAAGMASGLPVFEAGVAPGGICSSYYLRPGDTRRLQRMPDDQEAYRFELGGGHWIFGADPMVLRFIRSITALNTYARKSSVFFPDQGVLVPYPIQNHLGYLGSDVAAKALSEMVEAASTDRPVKTLADWLQVSFGPTLCEMFFDPFHQLYSAGLWPRISPQDSYKSPVDLSQAIRGAFGQTSPVGYNVKFVYPVEGLNVLAQEMARQCDISFGNRAVHVDVRDKVVCFDDGSDVGYETLVSTLPLNRMIEMTNLTPEEEPDPCTSVLVINIGAERGLLCPDDHWLYVPKSRAGFHRVGFYSNVDASFLPASSRENQDRVSIYVERAYLQGQEPIPDEVQALCDEVVKELQDWAWIQETEAVDPTWVDVAYTWTWPDSKYKQEAMKALESRNIYQVGRYARWKFQGIADSIGDGMMAGAAISIN